MKLVHYLGHGLPHKKNHAAIKRMTASCDIQYEETHNLDRLKEDNYDILLAPMKYIDHNIIPKSVKILYGPHFSVFPEAPLIGPSNPEMRARCAYNVLSQWNREVFGEFADQFIMPLSTLPFGVDTDTFQPISCEKTLDCVIYFKRRPQALLNNVAALIEKKGLKYRVFSYGSYNENDYKAALNAAKCMIVLDAHESQGYALEEAMSMNIPLCVLDATSMYDETDNGRSTYERLKPKNLFASSVPYWSDTCGIRVTNEEDLEDALDYILANLPKFNPREFVLSTLSDKVCMTRMLDYFGL